MLPNSHTSSRFSRPANESGRSWRNLSKMRNQCARPRWSLFNNRCLPTPKALHPILRCEGEQEAHESLHDQWMAIPQLLPTQVRFLLPISSSAKVSTLQSCCVMATQKTEEGEKGSLVFPLERNRKTVFAWQQRVVHQKEEARHNSQEEERAVVSRNVANMRLDKSDKQFPSLSAF